MESGLGISIAVNAATISIFVWIYCIHSEKLRDIFKIFVTLRQISRKLITVSPCAFFPSRIQASAL